MQRLTHKRRKSPRLNGYDYSIPGYYYVTICTQNKSCLFGSVIEGEMLLNHLGRTVKEEWLENVDSMDDVDLDEWILMPNHLHGIIEVKDSGLISPIKKSIISLPEKMQDNDSTLKADVITRASYEFSLHIDVTKRRNMVLPKFIGRFKMLSAKKVNILRGTPGLKVWQKSYWDRVIRDENDLNRIRRYIHDNPAWWRNDCFFSEKNL